MNLNRTTGLSLAGAKVDNHDQHSYCHHGHHHDHHHFDDDDDIQDRDIMRTYICGLHARGIASTSGKLLAGDQLLKVPMMMMMMMMMTMTVIMMMTMIMLRWGRRWFGTGATST